MGWFDAIPILQLRKLRPWQRVRELQYILFSPTWALLFLQAPLIMLAGATVLTSFS